MKGTSTSDILDFVFLKKCKIAQIELYKNRSEYEIFIVAEFIEKYLLLIFVCCEESKLVDYYEREVFLYKTVKEEYCWTCRSKE